MLAGHAGALHEELGLVVELEAGQHLLVADAAARILVHDLDELGDGVDAVADDVAGDALGHGDELAVHHQHAVVVALEEGLDEDGAGVLAGLVEGDGDVGGAADAERHAAAVVGVEGLQDQRIAEPVGGAHRLLRRADHALARHRQAQVAEDLVGLLLVRRDLDGDVARLRGDGGLDALLVTAVAELHQAAVVQAQPGDAARLGGADQRAGRRAELPALGEGDEVVEMRLEVERLVAARPELGREEVLDEPERQLPRGLADALLLVLVDHVVQAGLAGPARLAEAHLGAAEVLHLDGDVLEDVAEPGAAVLGQAPDEAAGLAVTAGVVPERGHGGEQAIDEARQPSRRPLLEGADVERQAHDGEVGVKAGAAVDALLGDLHRVSGGGEACRLVRSKVAPAVRMWRRTPVTHTGSPGRALAMEL